LKMKKVMMKRIAIEETAMSVSVRSMSLSPLRIALTGAPDQAFEAEQALPSAPVTYSMKARAAPAGSSRVRKRKGRTTA